MFKNALIRDVSLKKPSKEVLSLQNDIHENLTKVVLKNKKNLFSKPITDFSIETFSKATDFVQKNVDRPIILDLCCGVGESSFHLAKRNPKHFVIGIDKSLDRIDRKNKFKETLPKNVLILRGDIIDFVRLLVDNPVKNRVTEVKLFYPNPYPKKTQLQKRWHGHSIFYQLMQLNCSFELRSNWNIYLSEFAAAASSYRNFLEKLDSFIPEKTITPFERKYFDSGQKLYRLELKPI